MEYDVAFQSFTQPAVNPYRLRGKGKVAVEPETLRLEGRRSIPFWFSRRSSVSIPFARVLNVTRAGKLVSLEVERDPPEPKNRNPLLKLHFADESTAAAVSAALPQRASEEVARERAEQLDYNKRLAAHPSRPLLVPALIALNVGVYVMLGAQGAGWISADPKTLVEWGSNFGPLTMAGEWWRLATAMFLHGGLIHLLVNMYALYDTGRLCEQLYGHARFFAVYAASGLAGSAASVWWNPMVNSVGASGAIFGVFGAMLVFMLDKRNGVPPSIMKSHQASTGLFIVYALMNGMGKTGIDNAAHVGGLLGGVIMGWALARPVGQIAPTNTRAMRPVVGIAVVAAAICALLLLSQGKNAGFEAHRQFVEDVRWVEAEEKALLAETKALMERARRKDAKEAELSPKFAHIGERWRIAHDRLAAYHLDPTFSGGELVRLQNEVVEYLELRQRAMKALVTMINAPAKSAEEQAQQQEFERLWKESAAALQRIQATSKAVDAKKK